MKKTLLLVLIAFVILGIAGYVFAEEIGQMSAATNPSTVMETAVLPSVWIPMQIDSIKIIKGGSLCVYL